MSYILCDWSYFFNEYTLYLLIYGKKVHSGRIELSIKCTLDIQSNLLFNATCGDSLKVAFIDRWSFQTG